MTRMLEYRFKNLCIKHDGIDLLVNGVGHYVIEDFEEDGREAAFESAVLYDALGRDGYITSNEVLGHIAETAVAYLNNDSHLCRVLGNKVLG